MYYLKDKPDICPPNNICLKTQYVIIILVILSFVFILYIYIKITNQKKNNQPNNNQQNNNQLNTYLEYRDKSILYDPLIGPERRVPYDQYPNTIKNFINIPTRGYPDNYQLLGLLYRDNDEKIVQLYGRPTYPGSNEYEYYATTEQNGFTNKIPFRIKGNREIEDQQHIEIPVLKGPFKVKLYNYDTPRYYP